MTACALAQASETKAQNSTSAGRTHAHKDALKTGAPFAGRRFGRAGTGMLPAQSEADPWALAKTGNPSLICKGARDGCAGARRARSLSLLTCRRVRRHRVLPVSQPVLLT